MEYYWRQGWALFHRTITALCEVDGIGDFRLIHPFDVHGRDGVEGPVSQPIPIRTKRLAK